MNTNTWIKRSEREPGSGDAPVVYGAWDGSGWVESGRYNSTNPIVKYTHWRSIKCDPPPRELTQRERDEQLAETLINRQGELERDVLDGIYAERREVAKWLDAQFGVDWGRGTSATKATRELRARLDEQGAK